MLTLLTTFINNVVTSFAAFIFNQPSVSIHCPNLKDYYTWPLLTTFINNVVTSFAAFIFNQPSVSIQSSLTKSFFAESFYSRI